MSLIETYLLQIRTTFPQPIQRDEWRFTRYGLLEATKQMSDPSNPQSIITEDLRTKAMQSEGRVLEIPVMNIGSDITITSVRSCTIGDLENDSELVEVTWTTLVADLSMKKSEHHKNEISYLQDLNAKITRIDNAFAKAVEQLIYTKLDTDKSQVYNSTLVGAGATYPLVGNVIQVAQAQQATFFNDLSVILEEDDFYSMPFRVMGSAVLKADVNYWGNQGANNSQNTQFQFGGYAFTFSNSVVNAAGIKSTGFCMPMGSIGIMTRVAIDSMMENEATDGTQWGTLELPTLGFQVGYQYKSSCADLSGQVGLEHLTASMVEKWQLSFDVALVTQYNSDPANKAGGIKKFEFLP